MEILALVVSVAALAVSFFNSRTSYRAAKAAERSADAAVRAVEHQIDREHPKGVVFSRRSTLGARSVLVSNVGAVPFAVVEVGLGGAPFEYSFGESAGREDVRTVMPGASASFPAPRGLDGGGPAYAVIADGTVLHEEVTQAERNCRR